MEEVIRMAKELIEIIRSAKHTIDVNKTPDLKPPVDAKWGFRVGNIVYLFDYQPPTNGRAMLFRIPDNAYHMTFRKKGINGNIVDLLEPDYSTAQP